MQSSGNGSAACPSRTRAVAKPDANSAVRACGSRQARYICMLNTQLWLSHVACGQAGGARAPARTAAAAAARRPPRPGRRPARPRAAPARRPAPAPPAPAPAPAAARPPCRPASPPCRARRRRRRWPAPPRRARGRRGAARLAAATERRARARGAAGSTCSPRGECMLDKERREARGALWLRLTR
jgi:hypothetical protein